MQPPVVNLLAPGNCSTQTKPFATSENATHGLVHIHMPHQVTWTVASGRKYSKGKAHWYGTVTMLMACVWCWLHRPCMHHSILSHVYIGQRVRLHPCAHACCARAPEEQHALTLSCGSEVTLNVCASFQARRCVSSTGITSMPACMHACEHR